MFKTKYRIVADTYCGYEVQHRYWFWPFWIETGFSNTHASVQAAERYALCAAGKVIKHVET